jgi:predicted subunit of tRNA(5-methylaminomethyl-2-thiouridylate) methyltransferase
MGSLLSAKKDQKLENQKKEIDEAMEDFRENIDRYHLSKAIKELKSIENELLNETYTHRLNAMKKDFMNLVEVYLQEGNFKDKTCHSENEKADGGDNVISKKMSNEYKNTDNNEDWESLNLFIKNLTFGTTKTHEELKLKAFKIQFKIKHMKECEKIIEKADEIFDSKPQTKTYIKKILEQTLDEVSIDLEFKNLIDEFKKLSDLKKVFDQVQEEIEEDDKSNMVVKYIKSIVTFKSSYEKNLDTKTKNFLKHYIEKFEDMEYNEEFREVIQGMEETQLKDILNFISTHHSDRTILEKLLSKKSLQTKFFKAVESKLIRGLHDTEKKIDNKTFQTLKEVQTDKKVLENLKSIDPFGNINETIQKLKKIEKCAKSCKKRIQQFFKNEESMDTYNVAKDIYEKCKNEVTDISKFQEQKSFKKEKKKFMKAKEIVLKEETAKMGTQCLNDFSKFMEAEDFFKKSKGKKVEDITKKFFQEKCFQDFTDGNFKIDYKIEQEVNNKLQNQMINKMKDMCKQEFKKKVIDSKTMSSKNAMTVTTFMKKNCYTEFGHTNEALLKKQLKKEVEDHCQKQFDEYTSTKLQKALTENTNFFSVKKKYNTIEDVTEKYFHKHCYGHLDYGQMNEKFHEKISKKMEDKCNDEFEKIIDMKSAKTNPRKLKKTTSEKVTDFMKDKCYHEYKNDSSCTTCYELEKKFTDELNSKMKSMCADEFKMFLETLKKREPNEMTATKIAVKKLMKDKCYAKFDTEIKEEIETDFHNQLDEKIKTKCIEQFKKSMQEGKKSDFEKKSVTVSEKFIKKNYNDTFVEGIKPNIDLQKEFTELLNAERGKWKKECETQFKSYATKETLSKELKNKTIVKNFIEGKTSNEKTESKCNEKVGIKMLSELTQEFEEQVNITMEDLCREKFQNKMNSSDPLKPLGMLKKLLTKDPATLFMKENCYQNFLEETKTKLQKEFAEKIDESGGKKTYVHTGLYELTPLYHDLPTTSNNDFDHDQTIDNNYYSDTSMNNIIAFFFLFLMIGIVLYVILKPIENVYRIIVKKVTKTDKNKKTT